MSQEFNDKPAQGTPEWMAQRIGCLTASRMSDALAKRKDGTSLQSRDDLIWEIVAERVTGKKVSVFQNAAMKWGVETEPMARAYFEGATKQVVTLAPFLRHPDIEFCGASPDGFCQDGSLLEIKCPNTRTHLRTVMSGEIPSYHFPQMLLQLAVTGAKECHFVSFDPRVLDSKLRMFHRVFKPTQEEITQVEQDACKLLEEVKDVILKLSLA